MALTSTDTATIAREYLRVSLDKSGRERSITEQHDENAADAADLGWTLSEPYSDVGSASKYATKPRGDFDTLIADLRADRFGADVLTLWESSRGSRRVSEWLELIELCEDRGVTIRVTTHGRTYDPSNGHDRKSLIDDATDSEYESWKLSRRATRANGKNAVQGRPHGRVPFGYRRKRWEDPDPDTGRLVRHVVQEIEPAEAEIVRELFDRVAAGHSIRSITRDFAARGIRTRTGITFSAQHLRGLLVNVAYMGKRAHVPGRGSRGGTSYLKSDGVNLYDAQWPAIVDPKTWLAVKRILDAPERKVARPGRAVHLLSMIAVCDVCGGPLACTYRRRGSRGKAGVRQYQCHLAGHVRIDADDLEAVGEREMLAFLTRPDYTERIARRSGDDAALDAAETAVAEIKNELDDLADQVGRGQVSATLAARAEPALLERLSKAQRRVDELRTPPALSWLLAPGEDVTARWHDAPIAAKRDALRFLLTPDWMGQLRVTRSPSPGHAVPAAERVKLREGAV